MNLNLRFSRSSVTSTSLDKFIRSRKNLSKPPPELWPEDPRPDPITFDYQWRPILDLQHPIIQKLECSRSIGEFYQIYAQIVVLGLLQHSLAAGRVIKKLCTCFGSASRAVSVFDSVDEPDAFLGNTILRCFLNLKDPFGALRFYYGEMVARSVVCNHYTFPLLVKVFAEIGSVREGTKIHSLVLKHGFESDLYVRNSLIHMYSVCGWVRDARQVFDGGSVLDLVSWNSMIDGYVKRGEVGGARELFAEMPERDVVSWNSMLYGYVGISDMNTAWNLFEKMPVRDVVSWNCMIDGYARTGNVLLARWLFDRMPRRSVVSWNIMLALYVRIKHFTECLRLFKLMMDKRDLKPNKASIVSVLTACANLGQLDTGKWIHSYIRSNGIKPDVLLSTALLTMYAKCGEMDIAREVFDEMPEEKSVVSWNSMIMGYGMHDHGEKAVEMFLEMDKSGDTVPNDATFVCVLSACAHAGIVLEGWWLFDLMSRVYRLKPKIEHYGCIVDLLGRVGLTKDSEELKIKTPLERGFTSQGSLLSSCWTHADPELGKIVAKRLIELNPDDTGPYVLLSLTHALEGEWEAVEKVRRMMIEEILQKPTYGETESVARMGTNLSCRRRIEYSMLCEIGAELKLSCGG